MGWKVVFSAECEKQLRKDFKDALVTQEDIQVIKKWVKTIEDSGPQRIQEIKTWDDHPLFMEWEGYRSSMYSYGGRIIYRIEEEKIIVTVVKITPVHNYKKER